MYAQQLKNAILQEAIEGRLVPQDPNDEPASVLLARIRKEKEQLVKEGKLKKSALKEIPFSEDERPFEIPESWEWCKLGWIGDWGAGATPAKGNPDFYDNGTIPWLRTGELNNDFVYDSEIKVTPKALEKCSLRMCKVGDVLIAMYGATIGKVAIAGINLTTNQACCACTPLFVFNKYLMYYLMASKKTFIEMGEGGAQPNISREKIVAFPFPLPPLAEQHRIVAKIEELLPKVEEYGKAQDALNKLNAELPERLKKSILQEAIEGRLVPQDPNDEPASILLDKIRQEKAQLVKAGILKKKDLIETPITEDEIPFEIPESWEWVRFGDITINRDSERVPLSVDERSKLMKIYDYYGASGVIDKVDKYLFDKPLLLIGEDGANLINRSSPIAFIATGKYWVNNHAHVLDYTNEDLMQYMCWYINAISLVDYVTGTAQPKMNQEKMNSILVALPPLAEQHRIVEKLEQLLGEIDKLKK